MIGLGLNIWTPTRVGSSLTAQVQALFAGGKVGGMWDMGDTSTLYQTYWASTSVTAPNDPIGAVLDKSRPEQDKTAAFIAGNPTSVTGSSITKSGAVLTLSGSAINDEVKFDPTFAADDKYAYCEFTASGSGQILVYAGGSPVAFTLTGSPVACRASMTSNGSSFLIFRATSAGATGTITVTKVGARKGKHATQPTAINRTLYQVVGGYGCAQFDGVDDQLLTGAISGTSDMDCFIAIYRNTSARSVGVYDAVTGGFFVMDSGDAAQTATFGVPKTNTYAVDGVPVAGGTGTTRAQLDSAVSTGAWHIMEARNLNLATFGSIRIGNYAPTWALDGAIGGIVLCSSPSTGERNLIRTYLGAEVGLTL